MVDVVLTVVLALVCLAGTLLTVFQLPGTWLIVVAAAGYAWYFDWQVVDGWTVVILAGIAVAAEVGEMLAGVWFTRKGGGSRRAAWCGLVGGLAGALVLSIPVPLIGTIIGAAIGCFCGSLVAELSLDRSAAHAVRLGLLAAIGRTVGTVLKIAAALAMAATAVLLAILGHWSAHISG